MIQFREDLSAPGLWLALSQYFSKVEDPRGDGGNTTISIESALLSACAMFALKFPSLLQFDQKREEPAIVHNLKSLFHVGQVPSDTQMREIIDPVEPVEIQRAFDVILSKAQRGKALEKFRFLDRGYLISLDGTGYFESPEVHCNSCCIKVRSNGNSRYYHQFLPAVIVHPDQKQVIPVAAEPITQQDGTIKNDCELVASKRLMSRIRANHSKLDLIVLMDALHSNGPQVRAIRDLNMDFIIVAKELGNGSLFQQARMYTEVNEIETLTIREEDWLHEFKFKNSLWLNDRFKEKVNFLQYTGCQDGGKPIHWAWLTSIEITKENALEIMRGGRARWRIENETFNTLKNQGYQFEHNFGHGYKNLSTNFALLMLLAFAVDQLQELCCKVFQSAKKKCHSRVVLWDTMRGNFRMILFNSWEGFFESIILPKPFVWDSS